MIKTNRLLESTFWFALITHGIGLLTMGLVLMPGMPVEGCSVMERLKFLSSQQLSWQLGWLPWQLSALSDLLIALAFFATPIPRWLSMLVLLVTILAIIPDQFGQYLWITQIPQLAREALSSGQKNNFISFEQYVYIMVSGWASLLYTLLAVAWTVALSALFKPSQRFVSYSYCLWLLSLGCSTMFLLQKQFNIPFPLIAFANASFFGGLMVWFCWVLELVLSKERSESQWGRLSPWVVPRERPFAALLQICGQSKVARRVFEALPPVSLASEIEGVLYINYLVPAEKLQPFVPAHLDLQKLGTSNDMALFSILTFKHKHFGPQFFGDLRKLMPEAIVSNWRIHVRDPKSGLTGIYFLSNTTNKLAISLGARLLSEAMPMHLAESANLHIGAQEVLANLNPGSGSAADLDAKLQPTAPSAKISESPSLPAAWIDCFGSFEGFLNYCVPQERAISSQEFLNRICFQEIRLNIDIHSCRLLEGSVNSALAKSIAGDESPVCFMTGGLNFKFDREHYAKIV